MLLDRKPVLRYHLLGALILTFILRMSLPQVRYVYYPLFIFWIVVFLLSKPDGAILKRIVRRLIPYWLLLGLFLAASLYHTAFLRPYIEIFNGLELAAILIILLYHTGDGKRWSRFREVLIRQFFILAVITALVGLGRLVFVMMGGNLSVAEGESVVSVASDYNFFVLTLLYGLILGTYLLYFHRKPGYGRMLLYNAAMLALVTGIVLVPSRRGAIILVFILVVWILTRLMALFAGRSSRVARIRRLDYLLAAVLTAMVALNIFLFHTSHRFKQDFLIRTGLYTMDLRSRITDAWCRYGRMVDRDIEFREAYRRLWMNGKKQQERVLVDQSFINDMGEFRKQGSPGLKIVSPSQGMGCLAIRAAEPQQGATRAFYVDVGDTIEVTAMVRVIKWSRHLTMGLPDRDNSKRVYARPKREWEADGQWHPLRIRVVYDVFGSLPLWVGGGSSPDSSSLSCWTRVQVRRMGSGSKKHKNSAQTLIGNRELPEFSDARIARLVPPPTIGKKAGEKKLAGKQIRKKHVETGISTFLPQGLENALLRDFPDSQMLDSLMSPLKGPFPDNRSGRWKLAAQIFDHYSFAEKFYGKGLTWLPVYGEVFSNNPRYYDYPHNPLISTVLYSGVIGGLLYLAYLFCSLILYFRYRRQHTLFLVLFLLTGIFISVSGNSHFSVPAFVFFAQLPFFFSYIDKDKIASAE